MREHGGARARSSRASRAIATPTTEPSAITGASGPEHGAEGERADRRQRDTRGVGERRGDAGQALQRPVAAVAGQQAARGRTITAPTTGRPIT